MLISHTLAIHPNALDGEDAIFLAQPAAVHLVVGHDPEKEDAETGRQQAGGEEDDFPGLDDGAGFAGADGDAVGEETAEDLRL